ncbi:MAG: protein translocase subunit SecD [Candidatus Liptonbacteria bacterium]|nr:protein translocase subunit SecD [Candidatus Liptonbacteria bacterium]
MRRYTVLFLLIVIAGTMLAALFVYPGFLGGKWRPWSLGLDLVGGSHLVYQVDLSQVSNEDRGSVLNGIRDVIERRVNLFGVSEPQVFLAESGGETLLVAELAGLRDVNEAIRLIGETPLLDFREVEQTGTSTARFLTTELTGRFVRGAQLTFDQTLGSPQVSISFNSEGAKLFEELTGRNVGKPLAIFLDNQRISAPVVQEKISGGSAVISGNFSRDEALTLIGRFNAGALPAPITLVNQQTVSATLGLNSLNRAIFAGAAGTFLIIVFMAFSYGVLGIFAALSLIIYIILTLAVFKLIPITMTLAGVAGFILTIGMAIDANILIFERTKEEIERGLSRPTAMEEGFRRAWPSIRDSNITTIITAIILYYFTSSFIRGFALTLFFGVLMSMFSAITATRLFLRMYMREQKSTHHVERHPA